MRKNKDSLVIDLHYSEEDNNFEFNYAGNSNGIALILTMIIGSVLKKAGINHSSPEIIKEVCDKFAKALEELIKN